MNKMASVTIYTRAGCGYCSAAKALLASKAVNFVEHDATGNPEIRAEMMQKSGRATFPQIFINNAHIGGCDDLRALETAGKLDPLLAQ